MKRRFYIPLIWSVLLGLLVGTYIGYLLSQYIPFFGNHWGLALGPLALDLGFLKLNFALAVNVNAMSVLGLLFMLYIYLVQ